MEDLDALVLENLLPTGEYTTTSEGSAVDLQDYNGEALVILDCEAANAGADPTMNVTLEESDDGSTGWGAISGAAFSEVTTSDSQQKMALNTDSCKRYIRAKHTIGGTSSPSFYLSVNMLAQKHYA